MATSTWLFCAALVFLSPAAPVTTAVPESGSTPLEGLVPPLEAVFVGSLEVAGRADAPAPQDRCADAATQSALNECAYQEFLDASAAMSGPLRLIEKALDPAPRSAWRQVQKAWLAYRTAACGFERSAVGQASAGPMLEWQCAARMTRQRTAELIRLAACPEGDIACSAYRRPRAP